MFPDLHICFDCQHQFKLNVLKYNILLSIQSCREKATPYTNIKNRPIVFKCDLFKKKQGALC